MRDGNDSAAADEADGGLDACEPVRGGWADDGTVSFRPNSHGAQIGGDACAGAGTRSTRIAVKRVGILSETAAAAPSAGGVAGANIRPLAEIGFAQDDGSCASPPFRHERVF